MTQALAKPTIDVATLEQVVIGGDLSRLTAPQRVAYYRATCESLGLNPLTNPFLYIKLNGILRLYATRDCTDQLRDRKHISVTIVSRELVEGIYVVTAGAVTPDGRTDSSIGAVPIDKVVGEARANAMMKAETKAKRRVTLSICGLGMLDETEIGSIPDVQPIDVNQETGEILEHRPQQPQPAATTIPTDPAAYTAEAVLAMDGAETIPELNQITKGIPKGLPEQSRQTLASAYAHNADRIKAQAS